MIRTTPRRKISSEEFKKLYSSIRYDKVKEAPYIDWREIPVYSAIGGYRGLERSNTGFQLAKMLKDNNFFEDLSYLDLNDMDLRNVDFQGINLENSDLHNSDLSYSNFHCCVIKNTYIRDAIITGVQNLKNKDTEVDFDKYRQTKQNNSRQPTLTTFFQQRTRILSNPENPNNNNSNNLP